MKPIRIHIGALHRNRLPRLISPRSSTPVSTKPITQAEISRRHLLGVAAVAGIGLSPAAKMVETVFASTGDPFESTVTKDRIAFSQNGQERWIIDTAYFSGHPILTFAESKDSISIELRHAFFPGTLLPANFSCTLRRHATGWDMDLSFTLGGFRAKVPFEKWLAGLEPARAPVWLDEHVCEVQMGRMGMVGRADAEIFPQWILSFKGEGVGLLQGSSTALLSDAIKVAVLQPQDPSVVRTPGRMRTLVAMERGEKTWSVNLPVHLPNEEGFHTPRNAFSVLHIEAWEHSDGGKAHAVVAESGAQDELLAFCCRGVDEEQNLFSLGLKGARYVSLSDSRTRGGQQALVAKFADATPLSLHGCKFSLGHPIGTPPFEWIQYEDGQSTLQCEPGIERLAVPLAGALVQPMEVPFGARLILAQTKPRSRFRLRKSPTAPSTTQPKRINPGAMKPEVKSTTPTTKSQIGKKALTTVNDFRVRLQIPGPLAVSVVRPEDLLVLKFEFRNMNLQIGKGQAPRLVPSGGGPKLVVNFPPQHVSEQAFYETEDRNNPDHEDPKFPIDARLAGWSRLVFAIPRGTKSIPYALPSLLDWSNYQQVVAPSAAPPPPPPRRIFPIRKPVKPPAQRIPRRKFRRRQSFPFFDGPVEPRWNEVRGTLRPFHVVQSVLRGENRPDVFLIARTSPSRQPQTNIQRQVPDIQKVRIQPPLPPTIDQLKNFTAIEVPYRLFISPSQKAGWSHLPNPVAFNGRTELWHTQLGVRKQDQKKKWVVDGKDRWYRTMRAIWSPDLIRDQPNKKNGPPEASKDKVRNPFLTLPQALDRHQLVHLMANGKAISKGWQERVMKMDRFMLSALGAWIKSQYLHDPAPPAFDLIEWVQHGTMGRDQFVKVVNEGFLYPFGHKAVKIRISERKFERTPKGIMALLRYSVFIVVREPIKEYPGPGQEDLTFSDGRNFPYKSLQITNLVTPKLDPPQNSPVFKPGQHTSLDGFWPRVSNEDFQWHLIGTDWAGQKSEFSLPLIYIDKIAGTSAGDGEAPAINQVQDHYRKSSASRRTADLGGQKVAFGPKKPGGDTVLETASLTFSGEIPCIPNAVRRKFSPACSKSLRESLVNAGHPIFFPFVSQAEVSIPAIKNLLGPGPASERTKVRYSGVYTQHGFGGANKGELFLNLVTPVGLKYGQTDKVGGVGAPNMDIVGVSREFGPVGGGGGVSTGEVTTRGASPAQSAEDFAKGTFNPEKFFKDATILGGLDLALLLKGLAQGKAPKLVTDRLPEEIRTTFTLNVPPVNIPTGIVNFTNKMGSKDASLQISTIITVKLPSLQSGGAPAPSEPRFDSKGTITNFELSFAGQLILRFRKFLFEKKHGKKVDVAVELADENKGDPKGVEFRGALAFLAKLQELIPADGMSDPPSLTVDSSGVKVGLSVAIPSVTVGVLSLTNMKFGAGLRLPFTGDPVTLRINFCSRNDPFMGAVWIFGLTGFFAVEMNGKEGLSSVEVQIEFGGMWSIDIGVASGSVKLVAGFYFRYGVTDDSAGKKVIFLEGYIKVHGSVQVLGIVTVSILVKLALSYSSLDDIVWGEAMVQLKVEVLFFEVSVEWKCRKELSGSSHGGSGSAWLDEEDESPVYLVGYSGEPYYAARKGARRFRADKIQAPRRRRRKPVKPRKIQEMVNEQDWNQYAGAFADDVA